MKKFLTFYNIFKTVTLLFIIESAVILTCITAGIISYGRDVQNPIMQIGIFIGLSAAALLYFLFKPTTFFKKILAVIFIGVMIVTGIFYLYT